MISGIYKIENIITKDIYVGSSVNIIKRFREHKGTLKTGTHRNYKLRDAFVKYGEVNFMFSILEECQKSELILKEQHYLDTLKPVYNIAPNAFNTLGYRHTDDAKLKISEKTKTNKWIHNQPQGDSSLLASSYKLIDPDGNIIKFTGILEFCRKHNLDNSGIYNVLKGKRYQIKGYRLYNEDEIGKKISNNKYCMKEHTFISPNGEIVVFSNIAEFCRTYNLKSSHVHNVIIGKQKQTKGWSKI